MPDAAAGRDGAVDLLGRREHQRPNARSPASSRAASWDGPTWDGPHPLERPASTNSGSSSSATRAGISRSSTSSPTSRSPKKRTTTHINALDPNLKPFIEPRRQADSVSRLERSADLAAGTTQYYDARAGRAAAAADKIHGSYRLVHGAGHGALRRRRRTEHVRHGHRARAVGRERHRARSDYRVYFATHGEGRTITAALSVPAGGCLQGDRKHGRRGKLCVPG